MPFGGLIRGPTGLGADGGAVPASPASDPAGAPGGVPTQGLLGSGR